MIKFSRCVLFFVLTFILLSCSQVLETVELQLNLQDETIQEEFKVIEKTLTLKEAKKGLTEPYLRRIIQKGPGMSAGHFSEQVILKSVLPDLEDVNEYRIGTNDVVRYSKLNDNIDQSRNFKSTFPEPVEDFNYHLGVGDELVLRRIKISETRVASSPATNDASAEVKGLEKIEQVVISSEGRISSDGSVLLLEVGKLEAAGKTLSALQSEVRNIFIRNGLNPSFQLEIENFASPRAYLTINEKSHVVVLTNRQINLREILATFQKGYVRGESSFVRLQRNGASYLMDLRDVFGGRTDPIPVLDEDHIFVEDTFSDVEVSEAIVGNEGDIVLKGIGKINVAGLTTKEVEQKILQLTKTFPNFSDNFQIEVTKFNSQKALIHVEGKQGIVVPISNVPISLEEVVTNLNLGISNDQITSIKLNRNQEEYAFTLSSILADEPSKLYLKPDDAITIETLTYMPNKVFVLGGVSPQIINIKPANRETLADVLFTKDGVLSSAGAKRSEVYLLRGINPIIAYHLDAQSPTRLIVAEAMELRPNDILYVAEQPIISFNRALSTIVPLRLLLRDIRNDTIP